MHWTWDPNKSRGNKRKHGLSFETGQLVFGDPLAMSRPDPSLDAERWQTVGLIGSVAMLWCIPGPSETQWTEKK